MNKKLQVFVSSTYTDLIEERQAAVEAILDAGHIPAGMELFKSGNKSQLQTIYKWIDESDVYMLILGGRYGTVEPESGNSYTQLEYEYALSKNIPVFAVVISESFLTQKINSLGYDKTIEKDFPDKYKSFKEFIMSKIIRNVDDCKDIKINVHSTLNEFINEYDLSGWVRNNNENDTIQLLKDNNKLIKENNSLNKQIQELQEQLNLKSKEQFGNYSFDELVKLLKNKIFTLPSKAVQSDQDVDINALDLYITYHNLFITGISSSILNPEPIAYMFKEVMPYYIPYGLLEIINLSGTTTQRIQTTKLGSAFYAMLESKNIQNDNP